MFEIEHLNNIGKYRAQKACQDEEEERLPDTASRESFQIRVPPQATDRFLSRKGKGFRVWDLVKAL